MRSKTLHFPVALLTAMSLLVASCSDYTNNNKGNTPAGGNTPSNPPTSGKPGNDDVYGDPNAGDFTEEKMLINIGINVMARAADNFAAQAPVLKNSIRQYCEALTNGPARREEAQVKMDWERTMSAYHEMEAAPMALKDRGDYFGSNLYFWPYLNTCDIDNAVLENSKAPVDASRTLHNRKGLGAIEYLLFEGTLTSSCNMRAHPHMQEWNARQETQKKLERCMWAQELVKDVEAKSQEIKAKWDVKGENFTSRIVNNSKGTKEAINALTDSMANIEILKDAKLGVPTARHKDCAMDKCPQQVEHKYSGASLASAEAQLKGFKAIFTGSFSNQPAFGFDDLLIKAGRQDVSQKLIAALDRAIASVQNAQTLGTFQEQVEAMDPALCKASTMGDRKVEICAVHADVREVAFLLKTEVLAALALRAPPTHQGDND
ncbi:Imelysin [compost metagenome]